MTIKPIFKPTGQNNKKYVLLFVYFISL